MTCEHGCAGGPVGGHLGAGVPRGAARCLGDHRAALLHRAGTARAQCVRCTRFRCCSRWWLLRRVARDASVKKMCLLQCDAQSRKLGFAKGTSWRPLKLFAGRDKPVLARQHACL